MNVGAVLTSERRKSSLWGLLGIFIAAVLLFVGIRMWETFRMQSDLAALQGKLDAHESAHKELVTIMDHRLEFMEQYVFGTVSSDLSRLSKKPLVRVVPPEQWQRNQIEDIKRRLAALEKARMSQLGTHP